MVGTNDLWSRATRYSVAEVIHHDDYNYPRMANDLAIVEINGTIEFNDKVQAIQYSNRIIEKNSNVQAIGWGRFGVSLLISY